MSTGISGSKQVCKTSMIAGLRLPVTPISLFSDSLILTLTLQSGSEVTPLKQLRLSHSARHGTYAPIRSRISHASGIRSLQKRPPAFRAPAYQVPVVGRSRDRERL